MRFSRFGIGLLLAGAMSLPTGAALAGGTTANILQGAFSATDSNEPANTACIAFIDVVHFAQGNLTGTGLNADTVNVDWFTIFPDNMKANSNTIKVGEKEQTQVNVSIAPGVGSPTAAYAAVANPTKGKVNSSYKSNNGDVKWNANFEFGSGLSALTPAPDSDQLNTILAFFESLNSKAVKGNENKGKLRVKGKGSGTDVGACP